MPDEVKVLGNFTPSHFNIDTIRTEIIPHLLPCCRNKTIGIRGPEGFDVQPGNLEWHQDGGGPIGNHRHITVWATETPTNIKLSDGTLFQPEPHMLVWIDNDLAFHRQPPNTRPFHRWFVLIQCSGE